MADADARTAGEFERRVGAELVARGVVAPSALAALHAQGRTRGLARGGSFLAGAVLALRLAPVEVVDAALRAAALSGADGEATLDGLAPPPASYREAPGDAATFDGSMPPGGPRRPDRCRATPRT